MRGLVRISAGILLVSLLALSLTGCSVVLQKGRRSDIEKIETLSEEVKRLKMTEQQLLKLKRAYAALEQSLSSEIAKKDVSLEIMQKGLVISFVDSVLFDSGKAKLRSQASETLDKVADVCRKIVADREIGIEGHTDNRPIKHSGWQSNWELSTARATSVLHYLVKRGISPERLSVIGYGEYRPKATNRTTEGRQMNRRVEIVVLPEKMSREKPMAVSQAEYTK